MGGMLLAMCFVRDDSNVPNLNYPSTASLYVGLQVRDCATDSCCTEYVLRQLEERNFSQRCWRQRRECVSRVHAT